MAERKAKRHVLERVANLAALDALLIVEKTYVVRILCLVLWGYAPSGHWSVQHLGCFGHVLYLEIPRS